MASESELVNQGITPHKWRKFQRILVVIGGIMVHLTLGSIYTYGNIAPYFVSYLKARGSSPNLTYEKASWIFSSSAMLQGLFGFIGGMMEMKIGTRLTILIGCLLVSGGVALTYFTINKGFIYLLLTYGFMFGTGIGISYYIPVGCAMRWFPNRKGFIAGFVLTGFGGGAFIFNQIITAFINPQNLTPDLKVGTNLFFTQAEVLDNVPKCLLLLSGIYIAMQMIGIVFISNPPVTMTLNVDDRKMELSSISNSIEGSAAQNEKTSENVTTPDEKLPEKNVNNDMTTLQMLKTKTFYHLWLLMFCDNHATILISTFYKAYGQTFIQNDHFLSIVGAFASVSNGIGRVMWGLLADHTSFQIAQMCITTSITCLFSLFNISELGGRAVFFVFVCLIFLSFSGIFSTFPSVAMKYFGSTHYAANFGLLCTALAASNISASFLSQSLYKHIGYHGLFFIAAGLSFIGFILAFLFREPTHTS